MNFGWKIIRSCIAREPRDRLRGRSGDVSEKRPASAEQGFASLQAFGGPVVIAVVVFLDRGDARGKYHPKLLGAGENVDIGRQAVGIVERAHSHEADRVTRTGLVAP